MEINLSLGFISFLTSGLLFLFVLIIYFVGFQQGQKGKPFLLLISATIIWSGLLTLSQIGASTAFKMVVVSELLRYYTWFYVLQSAAGLYAGNPVKQTYSNPLSPLNISILFIIALVTLGFNDQLVDFLSIKNAVVIQVGWMMTFAVMGLILVEQLFRNTPSNYRWSISFLCITAASIFAYDFFVFSNALLVGNIDYEFWSARGIVNVLIIPTLLIAAARNPDLAADIHISRQFVFHSATLFGAGLYLVAMSVIGYYVKQTSGEWGKILQASFLFASVLLLIVLFFSSNIRARIKRYLSYSFRNKYDYREEWNRFSRTLLAHDPDLSIYKRALQAIGQIVESQGGSLWIKDNQHYVFKTSWRANHAPHQPEPVNSELIRAIEQKRTLITRDEYLASSGHSKDDPHWFVSLPDSWLLIPLWINDELYGFVHLQKSIFDARLDIEDLDLLDTIAHHVSLSLFFKETDTALQQAQKFTDMNQMTAFLMHDLKTVLSQLALLVENAENHKRNPDFVDDMVKTVEHTTHKMQRVMQLLKNPEQKGAINTIPLLSVLERVIDSFRHHPVQPTLINTQDFAPVIRADEDQLYSSIKNIVQNAVESVAKNGSVQIELESIQNNLLLIKVTDDGSGMSQAFIVDRLFRPFDSTKGVSGMGMGVYQSREYFRSLDGDLQVQSEEQVGSCFTIQLPVEK